MIISALKKLLLNSLFLVFVFVFAYLFGAFEKGTFDMMLWGEQYRSDLVKLIFSFSVVCSLIFWFFHFLRYLEGSYDK